ncbi:MAG: YhfC family glutamic-type intramembrane protease [Acutalibacteraceae bacterium]|nr:YhfC family glutamic-type intramembrane protease [Acutalibacteraceae bacterium]
MFNVILYLLLALLAITCAVAPSVYIKRKFGGNLKRIRDGAVVQIIFASILNAVLYTVLAIGMGLYEKIEQNELISILVNTVLLCACVFIGHLIWLNGIVKKQGETGEALLYGAGYSAAFVFFGYVLSSIANAVISVMVAVDENAPISNVFEANITQVSNTDSYTVFLEILQMLIAVVLEGAIAVTAYKVLLGDAKKYWFAAAVVLHFVGNAVITYHEIERTYIILIYLAVAITAAGLAYSLIFPAKKKTEAE